MKVLFISIECELLSLEYLSASLKLRGHQTCLILDPRLFDTELLSFKPLSRLLNYKKIIVRAVSGIMPDLICFSVCSDSLAWALDLASAIKENYSIPVLFGGIHPTILPGETIKYTCVDYVCVGEGEQAIVELTESLGDKKEPVAIPNIWAKKDGLIFANPPRALPADLDSLPLPDKELYNQVYPKFMEGYKIVTSRGCPYLCSYCASSQIKEAYKDKGDFFRRRSVENVIRELKVAKEKYPLRMVRFFDDIFTFDKAWLEDFSRRYKKEINLPYFCFTHPDNCNEEIINLLDSSGCATVFMGFGTFSGVVRENILRRYYSNERISKLIALFRKTRIYLVVDLILGIPGQTKKEVVDMAHFFNDNRPDVLSVLFLRYYPKTEITLIANKSGVISDNKLPLLNNTSLKGRIIIDNPYYAWLKKIQSLMLFSKYLPKSLVRWLIKIKFYVVLPPVDLNNLSVIADSVFYIKRGKRRIHTDTISSFQFTHFYIRYSLFHLRHHMAIRLKSVRNMIKKAGFIYRLGFKSLTLKKALLTLRYIYRTKILGKDCPGAIIIGLTYKCQCKCVHCSVAYPNSASKEEMPLNQIKILLDEIVRLGIPKVNFFGGEPLLIKSDLVELAGYASRKGLSISIDTNGILLTGELVKELKKAGINNINVSLDSADSRIHDELRGFKGAFDKALAGLKACVKERVPCVISTYASKRSVASGDIEKIITLGKESGVTAVKILFPLMSGRWCNSNSELLSESRKQQVYSLLDPGFVYLESPLFSLKSGRKVCEALDKKMLYISPYGEAQVCYTVPFSFGNIRNEKLKDIIARIWGSELFNSVENNCDCVMNNPAFRDKFLGTINKAEKLPVSSTNI